VNATARSKADSVKVPSRLFMNRKDGTVSFDTKRSIQPSSSKSATPMPIPLPTWARIPEGTETSVNVPSRLLWKREFGRPWYSFGWQ